MLSQDTAREILGRRKEGAGERRQEEEEHPSHLAKGIYRGVGAGTKEAISKFLPSEPRAGYFWEQSPMRSCQSLVSPPPPCLPVLAMSTLAGGQNETRPRSG